MSKNVFSFLFLISGIISLWIGGKFVYHLYEYFNLTQTEVAQVRNWSVEEIKSGKFALIADYSFEKKGTTYTKHFQFKNPIYTNPYIAEDHIAKWKKERWQVWYNPKNPSESSLQKIFPFKEGIHLLLCIGVLLYFSWLRFYIRRVNP